MKKKIQFFLFLFLVIISIIFYNSYFKSSNNEVVSSLIEKDTSALSNKNNTIKNLKYDVKFDDNSTYSIYSETSEIVYKDDTETVFMNNVTAKFNDGKNPTIYITSDNATFNNTTYNTTFENNVTVKYMQNVIKSKNLDLDFNKNTVYIYNNVLYDGLTGLMKTDNVLINLFTKNAEIFMNSPSKKVEVITK